MIEAQKFRELWEAWGGSSAPETQFDLALFMLDHAAELLALVEADAVRRQKALDELLAMDAEMYDTPAPEQT